MKYSIEEYKRELDKAHDKTCLWDEIQEIMRPFRVKLYQGLEVGDGVTITLYSDSHACTVIKRTPKTLWAQRDKAFRTDHNGMSDCQEYAYESDPHGHIYKCYWSDKYGCFIYGGSKDGKAVSTGRHEYYDYSF